MAEFKKVRARTIRKRRHSSSSDSDSDKEDDIGLKLQDIKEIQKLRGRPNGVSAEVLLAGKEIAPKQTTDDNDPYKMKTGGFVDMKALKHKPVNVEDSESIGTAFAAETNRRDEDTEMLKYVEEELAKKKGHHKEEITDKSKKEENKLFALPENLKVESSRKKTEDMLSNQMLSGIPEVDLGIEAKISNIEATEEAKQRLLTERMRKREKEISDFVPTNMAANFVQHNRFKIEDTKPLLKKEEAPRPEPVRVGDAERLQTPAGADGKSKTDEKATDDFYFEKFKKQMRRY
ncbi:telomere length and silencing protein 1 homolog [Pecten maximus]|uniref:telomere length and silencing protein 1 homolog n=1 Tax=Pecten maximus TaxID=6579 RepID=UPI001458B6BC|nr:telomere length and silencing protein 1 homolog [Pecten maximus]